MLRKSQIKKFQSVIWDYYRENKRVLPWRETTDPYRIWVSEVMLQQTQTSRVLPKYLSFIEKFPDFQSLAEAPFPHVLLSWSGLGYNRRALFLQQSAQLLLKDFQGELPLEHKTLETFPGIGKATACSILVFSKNIPLIFIETNIRRVFIHFFFSHKEKVSDREIYTFLEQTLDTTSPREFYYALMDYGAMLGLTQKINPNSKSNRYAKQSRFENSVRQMRGVVMRILLEQDNISSKRLEEILEHDQRIGRALQDLKKDHLISMKNQRIQIKK